MFQVYLFKGGEKGRRTGRAVLGYRTYICNIDIDIDIDIDIY